MLVTALVLAAALALLFFIAALRLAYELIREEKRTAWLREDILNLDKKLRESNGRYHRILKDNERLQAKISRKCQPRVNGKFAKGDGSCSL